MKIAVFPGSFDPMTKGHEEIVRMALPLFDKILIAIGDNPDKKCMFPIEKRIHWIQQVFQSEQKIEVVKYQGLTIDFCRQMGASYMIRGLRNALDFQYEYDIAEANRRLAPEVETMFFLSTPPFAHLSSSLVRELFHHHADYSEYVSFSLE